MVSGGAEERVEKPEARPEGRTRNVREEGMGAPSATAPKGTCCLKASDAFNVQHEPPYTEPYVRWCGRTAPGTSFPGASYPIAPGMARHLGVKVPYRPDRGNK